MALPMMLLRLVRIGSKTNKNRRGDLESLLFYVTILVINKEDNFDDFF